MNTSSKFHSRLKGTQLCVTFGLLLLSIGFTSIAQPANSAYITPFDQYGNMCWEDEQARLDNFAIQMQQAKDLFGDIVVYAGRLSCPDEAKYRAERAKKYVLKRGIKSERFQIRDGGYREEVRTILSLVLAGRQPMSLDPTLTKDQVSVRKRCVDKVFQKVICLNR